MASLRQAILLAAICAAGCGSGEANVFNRPDPADVEQPDTGVTDVASADMDAPQVDVTLMPDMPALPPLRDDAVGVPTWRQKVETLIDSTALSAHFASANYALPPGAAVYAIRVSDGAGFATYEVFEAGGGAFDMSFWPASTIKLLAALAALEWVYALGYTGEARVDWDSGFGDQLRAIYTRSITVSSNIDYDRTLRAAGWDFTNDEFLTAERGFPRMAITSSYASVEVRNPGGYTLTEGGVSEYVPGRPGIGEYGRNDTDLFELIEGVRRVMLNDDVPAEERFRIDPADLAAVQSALCDATPSYFAGGAATALGGVPTICHKPGWVPDNECLDHGLVTASNGDRYLLGASIPYAANCPGLSEVARHTLDFLEGAPRFVPIQPNSGDVVVQVDAGRVTVEATAADEIVLWDGTNLVGNSPSDRGQSVFEREIVGPTLTVVGYADGAPVAHFAANFSAP